MPDASVDRKAVSGEDCSVEERGCRNNSSQDPAGDAPGWR
ncbi:unknown [Bacteroides sp. CAG:462]|nr:unknown [Bacteroides sp. CAG:462]